MEPVHLRVWALHASDVPTGEGDGQQQLTPMVFACSCQLQELGMQISGVGSGTTGWGAQQAGRTAGTNTSGRQSASRQANLAFLKCSMHPLQPCTLA